MLKSINEKPKLNEELQKEGIVRKVYDFFKIFYIMQFLLIIDVFFYLVFLIDCAYYFLTCGNIKMTRHECQYQNG